jgi:hypothetical protein
MRTYGVICQATGFVVFVGYAASPVDACNRATMEAGVWGSLGPFQRSISYAPADKELSWLELTVYDVTGLIEPIPDVGIEDHTALATMTEDTLIDQYIARQF